MKSNSFKSKTNTLTMSNSLNIENIVLSGKLQQRKSLNLEKTLGVKPELNQNDNTNINKFNINTYDK